MEEYINTNTIIKDEIYNAFKDSITCPLCFSILISPVMCMKCQNVYCKKCTDNWSKDHPKCPNKCTDPNYQRCIGKNDILSRLKFKCQNCETIINYDNIQKHYGSCKKNNKEKSKSESIETPLGSKLTKISIEEIEKFKQEGNEITFITGKQNINLILIYL